MLLFSVLTQSALLLTSSPSRFPSNPTLQVIGSGIDGGYVYDIGSRYYSVARDGSTMYYPNGNVWTICEASSSKSYAFYRTNQTILKIVWNTGAQDSFSIFNVTNDCTASFLLKTVPLWNTNQAVFKLNTVNGIKASIVKNDLHLELVSSVGNKLYSVYYPYLRSLATAGYPFISMVGLWGNVGGALGTIVASTVIGINNFIFLTQGASNNINVTSVSISYPHSTLLYINVPTVSPIFRGVYSSFSGNPKEFPTYDANATLGSSLIFQYYTTNTGLNYNFNFNTMSFTSSQTPTYPSSDTRYYYKGNNIDIGIGGGSTVKLYLPTDLVASGTPYYTATKSISGSFPISAYWNESLLYIPNETTAFNISADGYPPQTYELYRYYQFGQNTIFPYCSNMTSSSLALDGYQYGLNPTPTLQLNISNGVVDGLKYLNYPSAVVRFDKSYTYINNMYAFNSSIASIFATAGYYAFFSNLFVVTLNTWLTTPTFPYYPFILGSYKLTIKNVCKSETSTTNTNFYGTAYLTFPVDSNFFQLYTYTATFSANVSANMCADPITYTRTLSNARPFNDYYLQNPGFTQFTFVNNNQLNVQMPDPFIATLNDYISRNFTIEIAVTGKRCGVDLVGSYDVSVFNFASKQMQIQVDAYSYDIKTTYTMSIDVASPDGTCVFTSNPTFIAGANNYQLGNNWLNNYSYNKAGNLVLNTTAEFKLAITGGALLTFTSLKSTIDLQGCPANQQIENLYPNSFFNGTIEVPIPLSYNGTKFYMSPALIGAIGTCSFQTSTVSSPMLVTGIGYNDAALNVLAVNSSMLSLSSGNSLQINLASQPQAAANLSYYVGANGFTVSLAIYGTSFPLADYQEVIPITAVNFVSNIITLNSKAALYSPCQRSLILEFQIQSAQCDFMAYRTNTTYGSGTYNLPGNQMFNATGNSPNVQYVNGQVIRMPFSSLFQQTFETSTLKLNANMSANTCGQAKLSSQTLNITGNRTLSPSQTYLDFVLAPEYFDTYALYNLNISGTADLCKFSVSFTFNAGQQGSVNSVLSGLSINTSDFQFLSGSSLKITKPAYINQISSYSGGYTVVKYVKADTCQTQFPETISNQFSIPDDYYNSTVAFTLQTNVQSINCQLSTNYTFSGGHTPRIFNAYYNFGNIEILGANLGSITGVCSRTRSITFNYVGGGSKTSSMATSWIDSKIVVQGDVNVISVVVTVGGNSVTALVSQPFFSIDTFLNNEITADGVQQFTIPLNIYGFAVDDLWVIDPSNLLYSSFKAKNGTVMTPMVLNLPKNNLASAVLIYFYIGKYKVPGLISVTIRRTPVISGQNLSPTIQAEGDKYQFAFRIPGNMKYSLVDYTSLTNRYTLLPQHSGLVYDASSILMNPVPGHIITGYDIVAKFVVTSDAVVGQTVLNGFVSGTSTTIGTFSAVNGSEALAFIDQNMTWLYDNQNTKILKVGDFPLTVNLSFIDTKKPVDSVATFAIVASLICPSGYFPNVFGQSSDGKISLCATCPVGATCSATGSASPKGLPGYYEINTNGVFVYAPCLPSDACQGSMLCNSGYGNLQFI